MVRRAALAALVVAACSSDAARPQERATSVTRRVVPPDVRTPLHPITQPWVLDDGDTLYRVPPVDPLRGGSLPDGVPVPGDDAAIPRSELRARAKDGTVAVVIGRATPVERVHAIVDALPSGTCFDAVVTRDGVAGALIGSCRRQEPERVNLTITVEHDRTYVGLSRVNEFQVLDDVGGRPDVDRLAVALRAHKASAFFADRKDLEVLGNGVSYGELVEVAEVAIRTGFTELLLVSPRTASARPQL